MNIIHPPFTRLDSRHLVRTFLTLTVMVLLVAVWIALFLWGLLITRNVLVPLGFFSLPWLGEQIHLGTFFGMGIGAYAPAFLLLFLSQLFFFYRMPRTQRRVAVPLEFVLITFLFITAHLFLFYMLNLLPAGGVGLSPSTNLMLTLVMLVLFFWLQAAGVIGRYLRRNLKKSLNALTVDIFVR